MLDHADLHRDDFKLFADLLADGVFTAAAGTRQLMLGKFMDDFDSGQVGGQRLTFAATFGRHDNFFFAGFIDRLCNTFCFIEERQLRRCRISRLLGLTPEQSLAQQRVLFFKMNNLAFVRRPLTDHLLKQLPEQNRIIRKVFGHGNHAADYTESGDVSRRQNLMRAVAPEVEAVE
ncbi:hypothetical protein PS655_06073 [Pseudomonas fluorescens]|uniref:Uncharacterized protein n=1 Tax=Pseudomonas fluorescens TaxID=294 RepID=A0A5E6XVU0_PSEFL|nr:hypothetical protein PS655_00553 [Pseudomonas fluorescens]VVN45628.1 hypothetical protein PS655_05792 [Pseudomonas fluorescens]VVN48322.1 hypothetical protein PS655_06073 [Pseudomonas fluorescens]